jgi:hypothetical protein
MRKLDEDVGLINGEGYMVEDGAYREHLAVTVESTEVRVCSFKWLGHDDSSLTSSGQNAPITRRSIRRMRIDTTCMRQESVPVHVHMAALCPTLW